MAKKKVFVSYDYENDGHLKRLLEAWNANPYFEFGFEDRSVTKRVDSNDPRVVKGVITKKLQDSSYCLVIVGQYTHQSEWVTWEIDKAKELGLRMVAVKVDRSYVTPSRLLNSGTKWALSFKQDSVIEALS